MANTNNPTEPFTNQTQGYARQII